MLVLSRKKNESIVINDDITITVVEIRPGSNGRHKVRLGVEAPKEIPVDRHEVHEAKKRGPLKVSPAAAVIPPDASAAVAAPAPSIPSARHPGDSRMIEAQPSPHTRPACTFRQSFAAVIDEICGTPERPATVTLVDLRSVFRRGWTSGHAQGFHDGCEHLRGLKPIAVVSPRPNVLGIWVGATIFGSLLGLVGGWYLWG